MVLIAVGVDGLAFDVLHHKVGKALGSGAAVEE